jgi:diguanylate cyclase (GGDEF)-like protein
MIVLIGLAARSRHSLFSSTQQLLFSTLGYTSAAYMLFDIIWTLSDGVGGTLGIAANWISNAASFSLFAAACLIWFIYSETVQGSRLLTARYRMAFVTLPAALVVVLAFTSYWTHALFYIDAQGAYRRGFVYMIQPIVSYCYVIYTSLHAFIQSCKVESLQKKAIYQTLAFFAIPALVGGTFQVVYSVPGLCVGIMISMLLLYIIYQEQLISTDPLTGLNNRNRFETYMLSLFSNVDQAEDVYLLMMDADGFKQINDRHGHVEGDHALQVISTVLKDVCSASGGFIARYGGDEFVVLQKATAEQDIIDLCSAINEELARAEVPYALRMSIGYARVGDSVDTWQDLLRAADAELYRVKAEKKKAGVQIR